MVNSYIGRLEHFLKSRFGFERSKYEERIRKLEEENKKLKEKRFILFR